LVDRPLYRSPTNLFQKSSNEFVLFLVADAYRLGRPSTRPRSQSTLFNADRDFRLPVNATEIKPHKVAATSSDSRHCVPRLDYCNDIREFSRSYSVQTTCPFVRLLLTPIPSGERSTAPRSSSGSLRLGRWQQSEWTAYGRLGMAGQGRAGPGAAFVRPDQLTSLRAAPSRVMPCRRSHGRHWSPPAMKLYSASRRYMK